MSQAIIFTLETIAVSGIVGAGVGYITNELALKWMFSGLGGRPPKIAANKDGLGISLGKAVSDRLLPNSEEDDEKILLQKLREENVEDALRFAVDDWLKNLLPAEFGDIHFNEIEGFDQTVSNLSNLITDFLQQNAASILEALVSGIDVAMLLPDSQQNYILDHLLTILAKEIDGSSIDRYVDKFLQENENSSLADILGSRADDIGAQLTSKCAERIIQDICDRPEEMFKALKSIALENAVFSALSSITDEPLSSLLGNKTVEDFITQNRVVIKQIIASGDFHSILTVLVKELLHLLHDVNTPLYQFFPINEQNKLSDYISQKLPEIMPHLLRYLADKRCDISRLVDDTVDSVIDAGTSNGFANSIRKLLKETILSKVQKIDLVQKIEELADTFLHSGDAVKQCRQMFGDFLHKTTVADIIALLDQHGALDADALAQRMFDLFNQYIDHIPEEFYAAAGNFRLSTVFDIRKLPLSEWKEQFGQWLIHQLKASPIARQKIEARCASALDDKVSGMLHTPISELLTTEMLANIKRYANGSRLASLIETNKFECVKKLKAWFRPFIEGRTLFGILPRKKITQLADIITQKTCSLFDSGASSVKRTKIAEFAKRLAHSPVSREITTFLQGALIPALKENSVAAKKALTDIVAKRIGNLDTSQIGEMMNEFMGKEMRPLCTLGAWIGAFIGVVMVWIADLLLGGATTPYYWWCRAGFFALIGILTNALAFWGLFKPYEPKSGIWGRIWEQGYIPKHKKAVAHQFGVVVQNEMLNGDTISAWFHGESPKLKAALPQSILKNDCAGLCRLLQENHATIAAYISNFLQAKLDQDSETVGDFLIHEFGQARLDAFLSSQVTKDAAEQFLRQLCYHPEELNAGLTKAFQTNRSLYSAIPSINGLLQKQISTMTNPLLKNTVKPYLSYETLINLAKENDLYQRYKHQTVHELIAGLSKSDPLPRLSAKIADFLLSKLFSDEGSGFLCDKIAELLGKELNESKTVSTIFDGQLHGFIDGSITFLTGGIITGVLKNLQDSKSSIQRGLINELHQQVNGVSRTVIDADNLVKNIVSRLIDQELFGFFDKEIHALSQILRDFFEREIYPIRISAIQLDIRKFDFKTIIQNALNKPMARERIYAPANELTRNVVCAVANQRLEVFADFLHIRKLADVIDRFEKQTKLLLESLRGLLCDNASTTNAVSDYAYTIIDHSILRSPISSITGSIAQADLQSATKNAVQFILGQAALRQYLQDLIDSLYRAHQDDTVTRYFDSSVAQSSVQLILQNKALLQPLLTEECDLAVRFFISDHLACIVPATRNQLANRIVSSGFQAISLHLAALLEAIKINCVVERVVLEMDGKSIHDMFWEFAQSYFNQLIAFGVVGGAIVFIELLIALPSCSSLLIADIVLSVLIIIFSIYKLCSTKH